MDVLFLAFANSRNHPLQELGREDDGVHSALVNKALKGHFLIHRDSYVTLPKINEFLGKYSNSLALFHFGGHAGSDKLLLDTQEANALGIARQLGESARIGKLKLVVLNGCATAGQVEGLLAAGVPAVIATYAPVEDPSAAEFSLRFYHCLCNKRMSIRDAFEEALGAAQTATGRNLDIANMPRGLALRAGNLPNDKPLWGLFASNPEAIEINPLPAGKSVAGNKNYTPNDKLVQVLLKTLSEADNLDIRYLAEKEAAGRYIEMGDKQNEIVNVLPYPIGIHLQKLLCPIEEETEGCDKVSLRRLEQIGILYHSTVEFLAFVMLAQLWELKLWGKIVAMPVPLVSLLNGYFYLRPKERAAFDYLPFIRSIREFFDSLDDGKGIEYFIEELKQLKELIREGKEFATACGYLANLRRQTLEGSIAENDIPDVCEEAEDKLCDFFEQMGFLHRYTLTSIQSIDIQKYRHEMAPAFSHAIVKLMRAWGAPERNYYLLSSHLDNRGVVLLKGKINVLNSKRKQFTGENLSYLNLSPFIIDRNAFVDKADLANLFSFHFFQKTDNSYSFKSVKRPNSEKDCQQIRDEEAFEPVRLQLEAFRTSLLGEKI